MFDAWYNVFSLFRAADIEERDEYLVIRERRNVNRRSFQPHIFEVQARYLYLVKNLLLAENDTA